VNTTNKNFRVALYGRVSTSDQVENGKSLADQEQSLTMWAKTENWQIVSTYIDKGVSGGTDDRPQLQNLLLDAKAGRFDLVICTKLDRFFRNTRLMLNFIEQLKQAGVALVTMDGTDTRKAGMSDVLLSLFGSMAQYERTRISERIAGFRSFRKNKNQWSAGRTLYGYRFNKDNKELEVCDKEAEAIRYVFNEYTQPEAIGLVRLAERMNKTTYVPPRAFRKHQKSDFWTYGNLHHILTRHAYLGGPNEQYAYKAPAIITQELWQIAQSRLSSNAHFHPSNGGKTQYQGRLICGICGRRLSIGYNYGARKVYECRGRKKEMHMDGSPRCTLPRFEADKLDSRITEKIRKVISSPELLANYFTHYIEGLKQEQRLLQTQLKPIQVEADAVREDMAIVDARLEMKRITPEVYKSRMSVLKSKLADIESRTADIDPNLVRTISLNENKISLFEDYVEIVQGWIKDNLTTESFARHPLSALYMIKRHPSRKDITFNDLDGVVNGITGEAFKDIIVYPDKIELKGNLTIHKLNKLYAHRYARL